MPLRLDGAQTWASKAAGRDRWDLGTELPPTVSLRPSAMLYRAAVPVLMMPYFVACSFVLQWVRSAWA